MKKKSRKTISSRKEISREPRDFILEIGCEELPANDLLNALGWDNPGGLALVAAELFEKKKIPWAAIHTFGTPRRLILQISGIPASILIEEEGPPAQIAFDDRGQPTVAAQAFARRNNLSVSQLKKKEVAKGTIVVAQYSKPAPEVLKETIPAMIEFTAKISFPRTMRWDDSGSRFARPIRWLLALYGSQVVPGALGRVATGKLTQGLRRSGGKSVVVKSAETFFATLRQLGIQLEEGQRYLASKQVEGWQKGIPIQTPKRGRLLANLEAQAKRLGGRLPDTETEEFKRLLATVTFLAENPVVETGSFQKQYLDLPPEVLATSMAKHLKLFTVLSPDGKKLLPKFLAVLEGKPVRSSEVIANIERILEARFSDARFFYREDTQTPLQTKTPQLEKVIFHEKLGSVGERLPRLKRLMISISQQLGLDPSLETLVSQVAQLCKADLVTQMVREFPSLQGVMGSYYARDNHEPGEVCAAIAQQYHPRTMQDALPATALGALLALADRLDTLLGYWGNNLTPTGSADPYGLRRQATGLMRVLTHPPSGISFVGLSIDRLFDEGIELWGSRLSREPKRLKKELRDFLSERFEWLARVVYPNVDRELIDEVLAALDYDWADKWERLKVLQRFWEGKKDRNHLVKAAKVAERTGRIVRAAKGEDGSSGVDPAILKEDSEKKLWELWNQTVPLLEQQLQEHRYPEAIATYGALYPEVHRFFESVFVMDEDPQLRQNRLAMMREIYQSLTGHFADLTKLPLAGVEPS